MSGYIRIKKWEKLKRGYEFVKCKICGNYAYANASTNNIMSEDKICWICKQMKTTPVDKEEGK